MLVAAIMTCALAAPGSGDALARRLDASLGRAREALLSSPELAAGRGTTGERALAALAALRSGAPADGPALSGVLARIFGEAETAARDAYGGAYHAGLFLMLIEELGPRAEDLAGPRLARKLAERLVDIQRPDGGWGDVSRTEFACLGLRVAERIGERVPEGTWARAERYLVSRQRAGGGWGYREGEPATGSMTAGACAALVAAGLDAGSEPVRRGLAWLGPRFRVDVNPGASPDTNPDTSPGVAPSAAVTRPGGARHRFYYLASLAAFARELGEWPEPAWAEAGARALIVEQLPGGGWENDPQDRPTEFATLFLVEAKRALGARTPIATVTVGVCSPAGRDPPKGFGASLARSLGRWSDLGADVRLRHAAPRRDGLPVGEFAFVIVLAGRIPFRAGDVAEFARYLDAGGTVVVEGGPALAREDVFALARRIRGGRKVWEKGGGAEARRAMVTERAELAGPAPLGLGEAPELLLLGEGLLIAPAGVFCLAGREETSGARSAAERAAANAFALAVSR